MNKKEKSNRIKKDLPTNYTNFQEKFSREGSGVSSEQATPYKREAPLRKNARETHETHRKELCHGQTRTIFIIHHSSFY